MASTYLVQNISLKKFIKVPCFIGRVTNTCVIIVLCYIYTTIKIPTYTFVMCIHCLSTVYTVIHLFIDIFNITCITYIFFVETPDTLKHTHTHFSCYFVSIRFQYFL